MKKDIIYFGNFFGCIRGIVNHHRLVHVIFEKNKENDHIVRYCRENNISFNSVDSKNGIRKILPFIKKKQPDFFLVGSFGIIFDKELIDLPKYTTINVHPGILPDYRGRHPFPQAILNREAKTGITAHVMTEEIDRGEVLSMRTVDLDYNRSYRQNEQRLLSLLPDLVDESIKGFLSGRSTKVASRGVYYKPLPKEVLDKVVNAGVLKELFNENSH